VREHLELESIYYQIIPKMKFGIKVVIALIFATSADAFQVKPALSVVQRHIEAVNELVTRPMAAGGAERAYGDDYYDGAFDAVWGYKGPC
jgi:hypothetical protein